MCLWKFHGGTTSNVSESGSQKLVQNFLCALICTRSSFNFVQMSQVVLETVFLYNGLPLKRYDSRSLLSWCPATRFSIFPSISKSYTEVIIPVCHRVLENHFKIMEILKLTPFFLSRQLCKFLEERGPVSRSQLDWQRAEY